VTARYGYIDSFGMFEHGSTPCCLKSLALLQVWLCSRTSKSISLGDMLALIKHRFHVPTCRVNDKITMYSPCLLTLFHDFSVYLISGT
jgi:hypothetical protein